MLLIRKQNDTCPVKYIINTRLWWHPVYARSFLHVEITWHSLPQGNSYITHHSDLYKDVGWPSLSVRMEKHSLLFIYKALFRKLLNYLISPLEHKSAGHCTYSQEILVLEVPQVNTEFGKSTFSFFAPNKWNKLQKVLKFAKNVPLDYFRCILDEMGAVQCGCFVWFAKRQVWE